MYAVIKAGGRQYRVEQGQRIVVDRCATVDAQVSYTPLMLVDGDNVLATPSQLEGSSVVGRVVDEHRGPKIVGFNYKPKANQRKRWGHRADLSTIEITDITKP